jgi:hypothetical protein
MSSDDIISSPWSHTAFVEMNEDLFFDGEELSLCSGLSAKTSTRILTPLTGTDSYK